jgi:hypothetical protein
MSVETEVRIHAAPRHGRALVRNVRAAFRAAKVSAHSPQGGFAPARARTARVVAAGVAGVAGGAVVAAVLALFAAASSQPWLPDTPVARQLAAGCARTGDRAGHDACMREAFAQWRVAQHLPLRIASAAL